MLKELSEAAKISVQLLASHLFYTIANSEYEIRDPDFNWYDDLV